MQNTKSSRSDCKEIRSCLTCCLLIDPWSFFLSWSLCNFSLFFLLSSVTASPSFKFVLSFSITLYSFCFIFLVISFSLRTRLYHFQQCSCKFESRRDTWLHHSSKVVVSPLWIKQWWTRLAQETELHIIQNVLLVTNNLRQLFDQYWLLLMVTTISHYHINNKQLLTGLPAILERFYFFFWTA